MSAQMIVGDSKQHKAGLKPFTCWKFLYIDLTGITILWIKKKKQKVS